VLAVLTLAAGCRDDGSDCLTPHDAWGDQCRAQVHADCGEYECATGYEAWVEQYECAELVGCVDTDLYEGCVGAIEQLEGCDPYPFDECEALHDATWQCQGL
jgi:hypothetical protein